MPQDHKKAEIRSEKWRKQAEQEQPRQENVPIAPPSQDQPHPVQKRWRKTIRTHWETRWAVDEPQREDYWYWVSSKFPSWWGALKGHQTGKYGGTQQEVWRYQKETGSQSQSQSQNLTSTQEQGRNYSPWEGTAEDQHKKLRHGNQEFIQLHRPRPRLIRKGCIEG